MSFCSLKLFMKNKFMDQIVNNIHLVWNLTCVLKKKKNMHSMVTFSKYVVLLIFLVKVVVLDYN